MFNSHVKTVQSLEFVACRIYRNKPGVLLLSAFTGAADLMPEALIVNPYEEGRVADYLHTGGLQDRDERRGECDGGQAGH